MSAPIYVFVLDNGEVEAVSQDGTFQNFEIVRESDELWELFEERGRAMTTIEWFCDTCSVYYKDNEVEHEGGGGTDPTECPEGHPFDPEQGIFREGAR